MKRYVTCLLLASALLPAAAGGVTRAELPAHAQVMDRNAADRLGSKGFAALRGAIQGGAAKRLMRDDPAGFEVAASQLLQVLADKLPSQAEREWVSSMLDHQPVLWQQHPETLSEWFIPLFDLAAQAAALQLHWQRQQRLATLLPEIERLQSWSAAMIEAPEPLQVLILQGLEPGTFDRLMQRPVPPGLGALAWRALLHDQHRAHVWEQALMMAPDDALRHSLPSIWLLDPAQARDWLTRSRLQRPAVASVAVAALRHDPDLALRHAQLFELLGSPEDYQSAAAALAADTDLPDLALIEAFRAAPRGLRQRALALGLRLRDSSATRRFLADWIEAGQGDAALRESLR